jgi:Flp pilus assembly protein TadG
VEMAIVMPVLLLIIVGIMELGLAFRDVLGSTQAAREGVRIATFAGNDVDADCAVIEGISPYLITYLDTLERVEIYHANTAGQQIPSQTNVYTFSTGDAADCDDWTKTVQWNSITRKVRATGTLDIIGVRIRLEHSWVSQLPPFSGSFTIDETAIGRLEPESF